MILVNNVYYTVSGDKVAILENAKGELKGYKENTNKVYTYNQQGACLEDLKHNIDLSRKFI